MQSDPGGYGFWSVHTLVHTDELQPCQIHARDVWPFELAANCNNSNLNFDGGTDLHNMAMFNGLYSTGARRVDMNTDGDTDAATYANEYDKATGP